MDLFLGIEDMPIYNFDKVLRTNNLAYMVVDWDGRKEIEPPKEAGDRWSDIYNAYAEKTATNETLNLYSISCEIGYIEMRFTVVAHLIYGLCEANKKEFGKEINAWGIPFNIDGNILDQIELLKRHLRIIEQNLRMKKTKLNSLKNDDAEETTLIAQVIVINEHLGIKLDIKKDSVDYFIGCMERLKEKLKHKSNG